MRWLAALVLAGNVVLAPAAQGQDSGADESTETIHWAYSSFLGTGYYRVSGDRSVFVLDMPFYWTWREPDRTEKGWRSLGVTWRLPVTLGVHRLDFFDDLLDPENLGTVSVTPGVEIDYLLSDRWVVRGFGHAGWGTEISGDEHAFIWDVGVKTRYAFRTGALDWGLLGEVFHAGYKPDSGRSGGLSGFGVAADFRHPIAWRTMDDVPLDLTWDLSYRWYGDELTFRTRSRVETQIDDEWRIGAALARSDRPIRLWFLTLDQVGIAYRLSSNGEFRGITLNVSGPLDR